MTRNLVLTLAGCILLAINGCCRLPRQSGTWKGEITSMTLYDYEGRPWECAAFTIAEGPVLKPRVPTNAVLVKRDMTFYVPGEIPFTNALVRGTLGQGFPQVPATGKPLTPVRGEPCDLSGFLIVKKAEPAAAPNAAPPHR